MMLLKGDGDDDERPGSDRACSVVITLVMTDSHDLLIKADWLSNVPNNHSLV